MLSKFYLYRCLEGHAQAFFYEDLDVSILFGFYRSSGMTRCQTRSGCEVESSCPYSAPRYYLGQLETGNTGSPPGLTHVKEKRGGLKAKNDNHR